jgi:hypothetical protein
MLSEAKHLWFSFQRWQMDLSQRFFASLNMTRMIKKQPVFAKLAGPKRHITTT